MAENFTFFKTYAVAFRRLKTDAEKVAFVEKLITAGIDEKDPAIENDEPSVFFDMTARPYIKLGLLRRELGAKGGSVKGECKARYGNKNASKTQGGLRSKQKQNASKTQAQDMTRQDKTRRDQIPPPPTSSSQTPPGASDTQPQGSGGGVFGVGEIPSFDRVMQSLGPAALPVKDRLRVKYDQLVKDGWLDADGKQIRRWCLYFATVASKMLEGEE